MRHAQGWSDGYKRGCRIALSTKPSTRRRRAAAENIITEVWSMKLAIVSLSVLLVVMLQANAAFSSPTLAELQAFLDDLVYTVHA